MSLIFVNHGDSASLVVVGLKIRQLNLESLMGIFYGDCTGADSTTNTPKAPIIHQLIDRSTHGCQQIEDTIQECQRILPKRVMQPEECKITLDRVMITVKYARA